MLDDSRCRNAEFMTSLMCLRELGWLRRNWRTEYNGSRFSLFRKANTCAVCGCMVDASGFHRKFSVDRRSSSGMWRCLIVLFTNAVLVFFKQGSCCGKTRGCKRWWSSTSGTIKWWEISNLWHVLLSSPLCPISINYKTNPPMELWTHVFRVLCRLRWRSCTWWSKALMRGSGNLAGGLVWFWLCMFLTPWYSCMFQKLVGMCFLSRLLARVLLKVDVKLTFPCMGPGEQRNEGEIANSKWKWEEQAVSLFPQFPVVSIGYGPLVF